MRSLLRPRSSSRPPSSLPPTRMISVASRHLSVASASSPCDFTKSGAGLYRFAVHLATHTGDDGIMAHSVIGHGHTRARLVAAGKLLLPLALSLLAGCGGDDGAPGASK